MSEKEFMTQLEAARAGKITPEMKIVARDEDVNEEFVRSGIENGTIIIFSNRLSARPDKKIYGVGAGLFTKVNANIGTSRDWLKIDEEIEKLKVAEEAGAHAIMDLSTGGDLTAIRERVIAESTIPVGTVPVYEVLHTFRSDGKTVMDIKAEDFLAAVEKHCKEGVDFVTVHCGLTMDAVIRVKRQGRIQGVVSRGGAFHANWMIRHKKENPFYEHFDELLAILKKYDVALSLGDGLRPGAIDDSTDRGQIQELIILGELQKRAFDAGVQTIIEGPGHVPMNEIPTNMIMQKKMCNNSPFYVLGPLVTDVAPGYDHITSAIGGAIAAQHGADFLCYVTPAEHLGLPSVEDVREGVIAARIAAHAGDIVKLGAKAKKWDNELAKYRQKRDWQGQLKLALDPVKAEKYHSSKTASVEDTCTMCGEYCSYKLSEETFGEME